MDASLAHSSLCRFARAIKRDYNYYRNDNNDDVFTQTTHLFSFSPAYPSLACSCRKRRRQSNNDDDDDDETLRAPRSKFAWPPCTIHIHSHTYYPYLREQSQTMFACILHTLKKREQLGFFPGWVQQIYIDDPKGGGGDLSQYDPHIKNTKITRKSN